MHETAQLPKENAMLRNWSVRVAGIVLVFTLAASVGVAVASQLVPHGSHAKSRKTTHCIARKGHKCATRKHATRKHRTRKHKASSVTRKGAVRMAAKATLTVAISSAPSSPTTSSSARFAFKASTSSVSYQCSIDGSLWASCPNPVTYTGLTSGSHRFGVRAATGSLSATAADNWTVRLASTSTTTTTTAAGSILTTSTTTATTPTATTPTTPTATTPTTTSPTTVTTTPVTTTTTPVTTANAFGSSLAGIAAGGNIQNEDSTDLASDLNIDQAVGAKWIRIDINWAQIQAGGSGSYNWSGIDAVVQGAESRGLNVLGVIVYTPSWDRPAGTSATYGPSPASYAAFASAAAAHYAALGVHAYEIWNEENMQASWTPSPSPSAYTAMLQAAYPAIKAAAPTSTVVMGGLSPATDDSSGDIAPVEYLGDVYSDGGKGSFDAVGIHPYCFPANPGDAQSWSAWYQIYGTSPSIRSVMVANGDGSKQVWATEFGAPTNGPSGSFVTPAQQAAMISDALQLWSSYSWGGPIFVYQGRDLGTDTSGISDFFGLTSYDGTPKPAYSAYQAAVAAL